mgnify:CR=1 FL=1
MNLVPPKSVPRKKPQDRAPRAAKFEKPLIPVLEHDLVATLQRCVHFSGKSTNTTVYPVGVRLGGDVAPRPVTRPIPRFVSARGLAGDLGGAHALVMDYLFAGAAGQDAKIASQTLAVLGGEHSEASPQIRAQYAHAMGAATAAPATLAADALDARLRQILIPWGESREALQYLSGTPLPCAAVAKEIAEALGHLGVRAAELAEAQKAATGQSESVRAWQPRAERAAFPIGGTKPQNAGVLTRYLASAWLQPVPAASRELRAAVAMFNGAVHWPSLAGPARLIASAATEDASGFDTKARLEGIARWVASRVLSAGADARETLLRQGFAGRTGRPRIAETASARDLVGPWIEAEGHPRTPAWARAMATETVERLQAVTCVRAGAVGRVIAMADVDAWAGFVHGALTEAYLGGAL